MSEGSLGGRVGENRRRERGRLGEHWEGGVRVERQEREEESEVRG